MHTYKIVSTITAALKKVCQFCFGFVLGSESWVLKNSMAMNNHGAGGNYQEFHSSSVQQAPQSLQMPADDDDPAVHLAAPASTVDGESLPVTVEHNCVSNSGRTMSLPPSAESAHVIGKGIITNMPAAPKSNSQLNVQHFVAAL